MKRLIQLRQTTPLFVAALQLACSGLWSTPKALGVVPAPDGGYPGGNTAEGQAALLALTNGTYNTAVGLFSLRSSTEAKFNTAIGAGALLANIGDDNTATGAGALLSNSTGVNNTANGVFALFNNTTGESNTAVGSGALLSNRSSSNNTAIGFHALWISTDGTSNTAAGFNALASNSSGDNNTATGFNALASNSTGSGNTAIGLGALFNSTGIGNTALGDDAGMAVTTANNAICIGTQGANVSNSCFIGHIRGITTGNADAIPVFIDSTEQLRTMSSSRRFKENIERMDKASEAVLSLKPVVFHYKNDKAHRTQFGLVAEDVADVSPDLVVRDRKGEVYTVRYDAVNAMLLNEFLKEHKRVKEQQAIISELKSSVVQHEKRFAEQQQQIANLTAVITEQSKQIQNVKGLLGLSEFATARISDNRPALRAGNNQ